MSGKILSVNIRTYPSEMAHPVGMQIVSVLVEGGNNDYAAYEGQGTPEWVADHGIKLLFEEAAMAFPSQKLEPGRYRR